MGVSVGVAGRHWWALVVAIALLDLVHAVISKDTPVTRAIASRISRHGGGGE